MYRLRPLYIAHTCSAIAVVGAIGLLIASILHSVGGARPASDAPFLGGVSPLVAAGFLLAAVGLVGMASQYRSGLHRLVWISCGGGALGAGVVQLAAGALGLEQTSTAVMASAEDAGATLATAGLVLVGGALMALDVRAAPRLWWGELLVMIAASVALLPLVAYGYAGTAWTSLGAAGVLLAIAVGILFSRPNRGLMSVVFSDALGGIVARRMLPAAIIVPTVLGWLRLLGQRLQLYDTELGAALLVASSIVLFCGLALWSASLLNRLDRERELADEALRQHNDHIYDLYSRAPCGYHSLDEQGVYVAINDTELQWLGRPREEVVGVAKFCDFLTPESQQRFAERFEKFKQHGSATGVEFSLIRGDGSEMPVILNATAVYDGDGRYLTSRSTLFDATELKRAEENSRELHAQLEKRVRERTDELARSNAELMQKNRENAMYVYGVSHDLRSPLVNLEGFSSELSMVSNELRELIASSDLPEDFQRRGLTLLDEDMKQSIRFIQTAVQRLSNIIDALLRLSRAGRVEYQRQRVNLDVTVSRIIEAMRGSIDERSAEVSVGELPPVFGDPTAVEQVFANLIGNAVNYLDPERPGKVEVGSIRGAPNSAEASSESEDAPMQTFYVRDNGLGIAEAYQPKVFQALKRMHPQAAKGEGVGLALVRRIVERHGGRIWFESEEGAGTTFYFTLPADVQQHAA